MIFAAVLALVATAFTLLWSISRAQTQNPVHSNIPGALHGISSSFTNYDVRNPCGDGQIYWQFRLANISRGDVLQQWAQSTNKLTNPVVNSPMAGLVLVGWGLPSPGAPPVPAGAIEHFGYELNWSAQPTLTWGEWQKPAPTGTPGPPVVCTVAASTLLTWMTPAATPTLTPTPTATSLAGMAPRASGAGPAPLRAAAPQQAEVMQASVLNATGGDILIQRRVGQRTTPVALSMLVPGGEADVILTPIDQAPITLREQATAVAEFTPAPGSVSYIIAYKAWLPNDETNAWRYDAFHAINFDVEQPITPTITATSTGTAPTPTPSPTPTPTSPSPTAPPTLSPTPSGTPPTEPTPTPAICVCSYVPNRVPPAVLSAALANPASIGGWQQPADLGKPVSPYNPPRTCLALVNPSLPYHPLYNGLVFKAGCP
jgi:hypothetical protein